MPKKEHHGAGKHKRKLHKIITTRAKDGSFGHEHVYEGEPQAEFAGTSQSIDDLKQHHEDHWGGGGEAGAGGPEAQEEAAEHAQPGGEEEPEPGE